MEHRGAIPGLFALRIGAPNIIIIIITLRPHTRTRSPFATPCTAFLRLETPSRWGILLFVVACYVPVGVGAGL